MSLICGRLLVFGLLFAAAGGFGAESFYATTYGYGPQGPLRIGNPELVWEVRADDGSPVQSSRLKLNDRPVPSHYDKDRGALVATGRELRIGDYAVKAEVTFRDGYTFRREWKFAVVESRLLPEQNDAQREAVETINELRRRLKLPPVRVDARLNAASQGHAEYMARNEEFGHGEREGKPGFLGIGAAERVATFGWCGGVFEDVAFGHDGVPESVRELFHAPYHRVPFLQPGTIAVGSGYVDRYFGLTFGATSNSAIVTSPGDGQTGVPRLWDGNETPNPLRLHAPKGPIGYPIVLAAFGESSRKLRFVSATLRHVGESVPVFVNHPGNDDHLKNAVILIPQRPLAKGATYEAAATVRLGEGDEKTTTWSFTTSD